MSDVSTRPSPIRSARPAARVSGVGRQTLRHRFLLTAALCLAVVALAGCGGGEPAEAPQGGPLKVVATTGMIADLVARVGGDDVSVTGLMGPGVDPHYYKATQGDLKYLTEADVIFFNGLFLEGKMEEIFDKMSRSKRVVAVSRAVDEARLRTPPEYEGNPDPHIWFDVDLWRQTIPVVEQTLAQARPEAAERFAERAAAYAAELEQLHTWVRGEVAQIPAARRVLVTAHDAFGYFGDAYGIEVTGLQGISTVAEYGVNDVRALVDLIVDRGVKAIFVESSVPERSINAVKEGCLARGHQVVIGGTLYSDAMGEPGSGADTYTGMVRSNVSTIVGALK
jgi:manganese/zinc/iron transport system substrate-binding protein